MSFCILTVSPATPGHHWKSELQQMLQELIKYFPNEPGEDRSISLATLDPGWADSKQSLPEAQVYYIDSRITQSELLIQKLRMSATTGRARAFCVWVEAESVVHSALPQSLQSGQVDHFLTLPLRVSEVFSQLKHLRLMADLAEVENLNRRFHVMLDHLQDDLQLAERLQKARLPEKFPDLKGFLIRARYLAGLRAGGDHFDVAEGQNGSRISFVLTDSSSYRLASAVLALLVRVAMKLTLEQSASSTETVRKILEELKIILGQKDELSLLYGVVSRTDLKLRYTLLGNCVAALQSESGAYQLLQGTGQALRLSSEEIVLTEEVVTLKPGDRLVASSAGFVDVLGGKESFLRMLNQKKSLEADDILNELSFQVKNSLEDADDLPARDCTAIILDVKSNVLRLA